MEEADIVATTDRNDNVLSQDDIRDLASVPMTQQTSVQVQALAGSVLQEG